MSQLKLDAEAFKGYITGRLQALRREGTYVHAIYLPNEMKEFLRDNLLNGGLTGVLSYSTNRHGKVVPYLYGIRCEFVDRELSHPDWFVTDKNPAPPVSYTDYDTKKRVK